MKTVKVWRRTIIKQPPCINTLVIVKMLLVAII